MQQTPRTDGTGLIAHDSWLEPYADKLRARYDYYRWARGRFDSTGGLLGEVSQGHHFFGFNRGVRDGKRGVWYREWAPEAIGLSLVGDFNGWNRDAHPMTRETFGVWSLFLSDEQYADRLTHGSLVKVHVHSGKGHADRIPAYIRRVVQDEHTKAFTGQFWMPPEQFEWRHKPPLPRAGKGGLRIYEAHVGMAQEQGKVGSFGEFERNILPRIADLGYNAIQFMAIMEHPYYGSFGYHVSNFFAVSSRFGTPEELKRMIDTAHGMGIAVIMDIIHSHAVKNTQEGLADFDGSDFQYFHAGPRGHHVAWDSKLFDYNKYEVLRFLLSNCRFWLEEYRFDGFRFDGVTSMLYLDHGLGKAFAGYDCYFDDNVDKNAVAYLQLANELIHEVNPHAITVAEDVSGMAGMARPVAEGGVGFDYRLAMGVPDYWIKLLKEQQDENWDLGNLVHTLLNRRRMEKHIGYAESHDQALVGDKTLAFWLMDKEMYFNMAKSRHSVVVDRGVAMHKMIRLLTFSLAGEGYLNFMGNEFGHPEWIDFPREGNNFSYHYARRQWSLADDGLLRYGDLRNFDKTMQQLDEQFGVLEDPFIETLMVDKSRRLIVFRRGPLVFAFNLHPTESFESLRIPVPDPMDYRLVLDTDAEAFSGFGRVAKDSTYWLQPVFHAGRKQSVQMYLPSRSAQVLAPA